jgi:hypothetical protein
MNQTSCAALYFDISVKTQCLFTGLERTYGKFIAAWVLQNLEELMEKVEIIDTKEGELVIRFTAVFSFALTLISSIDVPSTPLILQYVLAVILIS